MRPRGSRQPNSGRLTDLAGPPAGLDAAGPSSDQTTTTTAQGISASCMQMDTLRPPASYSYSIDMYPSACARSVPGSEPPEYVVGSPDLPMPLPREQHI